MSKARLIKRLQWYYPTERFHTFVTFPLLLAYALYSFPFSESVLLCYGFLICIFILYQGQHYWKLKLHRLTNKPFDQPSNIRFFNTCKNINIKLIVLMPAFIVFQLYLIDWQLGNSSFLLGLFVNLFALLEHINYYRSQLMIDNEHDWKYIVTNKKLKVASLAKDLKDQKF